MQILSIFHVSEKETFHPFFWLWLPAFFFVASLMIGIFVPTRDIQLFVGENGVYEVLQVVVLFYALATSIRILANMDHSIKWRVAWIALAALSCLYVAGEEVSWGQHILKWGTPEYWQDINDQGETNLHNTSSWLDQKPRLLLIIGVYVGGLIIPMLVACKPNGLPKTFQSIYPNSQLMVTAMICLSIKIYDKILDDFTDGDIFGRNAEVEELYLFYFVLLYLLLMRKRLVNFSAKS